MRNQTLVSTACDQPSVLVVDDERPNLDAFRRVFRHQFRIRLCNIPHEGLDALRTDSFDLIVVDHAMPEMTGVEFLLAAREIAPETGRVIVTGYPDLPEVRDANLHGLTDAIVMKPWKKEEIMQWVQHFYEARKTRLSQGVNKDVAIDR